MVLRRRLCRDRLGGPRRRHDPGAVDALGRIHLRGVGGGIDLGRTDGVQPGQGAGIGDVGQIVLMLGGDSLRRNRFGGTKRRHDLGVVGAGDSFALRCVGRGVDLGGADRIQRCERAGIGDVRDLVLMLAGRLRRDRLGRPQRRHDLGVVDAGHGVALRCVGRGSNLGGADRIQRGQRAGIGDVGEIVLMLRGGRLHRDRFGGAQRRHDLGFVGAGHGVAVRRIGRGLDLGGADAVQRCERAGIRDVGQIVLMLAGRLRRDRLGGAQRRHDLGVVGAGHGVALRCVGRGSDLGGADDVERRQRAGIGDVGEIVLVMRRRRLCRNRLGGPGRRHDPRAVDALGGIALRRVGGRIDLRRADRVQSGQGAGIGDVGERRADAAGRPPVPQSPRRCAARS